MGKTCTACAFLLGLSVGKLRARPVYGAGPDLTLRALLYADPIAFPTKNWTPRPLKEAWRLIEAELESEGYRIE